MPFIGNQPATSFEAVKKDRFTSLTGTSVTLSHAVSTVEDIVLWINAVKQDYTSYSVNNTTLTVGGSLVSSDIVEVAYLGRTFQTVNPPDGSVGTSQLSSTSVTSAKLNNDIISGTTELASEPADTDEFLISDAGTLKRIDYSLIKGGGLTEADQWRLSANITSSGDITSNLERPDHSGFGYIGTGMSQSSGIFTFPSTGIYNVSVNLSTSGSGGTVRVFVYQTNNNSSYSIVAAAPSYAQDDQGGSTQVFVDVTDTSQVKIKFNASSIDGGEAIAGASNYNRTVFTFMKLGDT